MDRATCLYTRHVRGKGGLATLIGSQWDDKMINHGISPCHKTLWTTFNIEGQIVGIRNIYASNDYRERASF